MGWKSAWTGMGSGIGVPQDLLDLSYGYSVTHLLASTCGTSANRELSGRFGFVPRRALRHLARRLRRLSADPKAQAREEGRFAGSFAIGRRNSLRLGHRPLCKVKGIEFDLAAH